MCLAAGAPQERRQGVPSDAAVRAPQKALRIRVQCLRRDPNALDSLEAGRSNSGRDRLTGVADALRPREGGACSAELRQRDVGGSR